MNYEKGDLVLTSDENQSSTRIILTEMYSVESSTDYSFYYTYCIETGLYGIVYDTEITALVSKNFTPEFEFHSEIFETDWSFYDYLFEAFSYFPQFSPDDGDSSEED